MTFQLKPPRMFITQSTLKILKSFTVNSNVCLSYSTQAYSTAEKNQVLIRKDPKRAASTGANKAAAAAAAKDKLLKTITPIVDESVVNYQTASMLARKSNKAIEMPMETRLENLALEQSTTGSTKNVAQLLIQGLHNHDSK